jgi:hypothetical protein
LDNQQGLSFKGGWYPMSQKKQFPAPSSHSPDPVSQSSASLDFERFAQSIRKEVRKEIKKQSRKALWYSVVLTLLFFLLSVIVALLLRG